MPAEQDESVTVVPLEPVGGEPPAGEGGHGPVRPRRGWWLAVAVVVVLGAAAVVASLLTGADPPDEAAADEAAPPEEEAAETSDASPSENEELPDEASTDLGTPAEPEADAAGDASAADDADTETEAQRGFGEPEHPISGVEPYIPSRVRPVELGPPAEVCTGTLASTRIQLPLRFASTKPEGIEQLTWSPDCRRVVFRMDATLWLAEGDGTGDMPFLTAQHGLSAPVWSPDSQWIAFSQGGISEGERVSHILRVLPNGLGLAQITDGLVLDREPAWSPDESQIAFARRVRVTDADGGTRFEHHIVLVDLLDGAEQVVSVSAERSSAPSWSSDGSAIAFRVGDELRAVQLDDLADATLLAGVVGSRGSWSPDGSRLAAWREWSAGSATIVVSDLPGQDPGDQHVIDLDGLEPVLAAMAPTLQWSADGQRLFFFRSDSPTSHWAYSLVVPPPTRSPLP